MLAIAVTTAEKKVEQEREMRNTKVGVAMSNISTENAIL